jgi:hypothetical protein
VSVVVVASPPPLIAQHGSTIDWQFDDVAFPLPLTASPPSLVAFPSPLTARTWPQASPWLAATGSAQLSCA